MSDQIWLNTLLFGAWIKIVRIQLKVTFSKKTLYNFFLLLDIIYCHCDLLSNTDNDESQNKVTAYWLPIIAKKKNEKFDLSRVINTGSSVSLI